VDWYYFNYTVHYPEGRWERRAFLHKWWRLYAGDRRWAPPHYPTLWRSLQPARNPYLVQRKSLPIYLEALPRRRPQQAGLGEGVGLGGAFMEEPVAAALLLSACAAEGGVAYLGLLQCVNDLESLERLWGELSQHLWERGCQRVLGPTGLSPHLSSGALQNFFHVVPPLHTPYNPPYLPELLEGVWDPVQTSRLYHVAIPGEAPAVASSSVRLSPFAAPRLAADLFVLFQTACAGSNNLPPLDRVEAAFLLDWLQTWPLVGWLAEVDEQPVGFILLQPDLAHRMLRAGGGRNWGWRLWLKWRSRQPVREGRLLYGAVLPAWRGQGIGRRLWQQALYTAHAQRWRTLTVGPVVDATPAASFLVQAGAKPHQQYVLYGSEL
jgi:GNAT superfamily N-acetyltransferase